MTTSAIAVTEGSGKNIWTDQRTVAAAAREAQYVVLAEPALPTFSVVASGVSAATTGAHILQIMAGASTNIRVHQIVIEQRGVASPAAAVMGVALYRLTTAGSGGTSVTPRPFDTADTATATAQTLPSSKGTEGVQLWQWELEAELTRPFLGIARWETSPRCKPIIIPAGTANGLALKVVAGVTSVTLTVNVLITETAWL